MKNFKTYDQAKNLYLACQGLRMPNWPVRDQFQRAALSVVLNLAEGYGRRTQKDRRRHYTIALGSLREVQAILDIIEETEAAKSANRLGAMLYRLCQRPGGD